MVASINTYDRNEKTDTQIFYPSPRTEQLIQVKEKTLVVQFMAETSLIVNIENLGGEVNVRWEKMMIKSYIILEEEETVLL